MYRILLLLLISIVLAGGCVPRTYGDKKVQMHTYAKPLQTGKSLYITLIEPLPPAPANPPSYIAAQFAKMLSQVSREAISGSSVTTQAEALTLSKANMSTYTVLLKIDKWEDTTFMKPGQDVALDILVLDTANGTLLVQSRIESRCPSIISGNERSPRECVRPQVEQWIKASFGVDVLPQPFKDPTVSPEQPAK